jgi:alkanesulfonate monooxygenase SsuD/methylene tetrahydromethanopterin reductase-like flavin-dependent oxidoreductase (luciferase family)
MFRETLEHVVLAERLGFDYMWGVEHHFLEGHSLSSSPGTWLAAAAAITKRIRIGHGIACVPCGALAYSKGATRSGRFERSIMP